MPRQVSAAVAAVAISEDRAHRANKKEELCAASGGIHGANSTPTPLGDFCENTIAAWQLFFTART